MEGRTVLALVSVLLGILLCASVASAKPSFNGTTAGCGGSGCHTFQSGIVTASAIGNLQVRVTLSGAGTRVAGELVDASGTVVAVIDQTTSNPFTLTAPQAGTFRVSAGYDSPNRRWDTVRVNITTTSVEGEAAIPGSFRLEQNYPNPFNPSTTIGFVVGRAARVALRMYDVAGKEIATLVDSEMPAGAYNYTFDASSLASGIYFYRFVAGDFVATRKMVITK